MQTVPHIRWSAVGLYPCTGGENGEEDVSEHASLHEYIVVAIVVGSAQGLEYPVGLWAHIEVAVDGTALVDEVEHLPARRGR